MSSEEGNGRHLYRLLEKVFYIILAALIPLVAWNIRNVMMLTIKYDDIDKRVTKQEICVAELTKESTSQDFAIDKRISLLEMKYEIIEKKLDSIIEILKERKR